MEGYKGANDDHGDGDDTVPGGHVEDCQGADDGVERCHGTGEKEVKRGRRCAKGPSSGDGNRLINKYCDETIIIIIYT